MTLLCALLGACGPGTDTATESGVAGPSTGVASSESGESSGSATANATSTSTSTSTDTSTSTGVSATDESVGGETTGCEFICETDAPHCDQVPGLDGELRCMPCDLFSQDCPDGQKCAGYDSDGDGSWNSTKCVDAGDGLHGDPCTAKAGASGIDDCAKGVMCWDVNEGGEGTCVELCTGTWEEPLCGPPDTHCVIANEDSLNLCLPSCDPLLQDCDDGEMCIVAAAGENFVCWLDASDGMAPEGTPCEFSNACDPGLMCASPDLYPAPDCEGALGCCAPFCDLSEPDACGGLSVADAECISYYEPEPAPPGLENVGVCGTPPP